MNIIMTIGKTTGDLTAPANTPPKIHIPAIAQTNGVTKGTNHPILASSKSVLDIIG
jgi:hypothetical protein